MSIFQQKQTIYRVIYINNQDGTYDSECAETDGCFETFEQAEEWLKEEIEDTGGIGYVYECKPILKAVRGRVRVTKL